MGKLKKLTGYRLFLPLSCLIIVLLINLITTPTFFRITINNGVLYGYIIDVINRASELVVLAVGMMVDNSIVVIENIYRMRSEGTPAAKAAVRGAREVAGAIAASTLTTICVFLPIGILVLQSLMLKLGDYSLSNFSLHYWVGFGKPDIFYGEPGVFRNPQFMQVLGNSLKLVVVASLVATVFGQLIGYVTSRGRQLKSGKLVEQLVFIPYLIPSIAFGAMYLALFATAKKIEMFGYRITLVPSLYGSFALLVLIAVVKNMPFASRAGTSNMLQISTELEEAAQVENAGFLRRFFKIVFPLSKGGMISGFMLVFISIMKELDLIVILMTPSQQTLPYMAYAYSAENLIQLSSAVTIVMFVLVFFVYWFANTFTDADITKGF